MSDLAHLLHPHSPDPAALTDAHAFRSTLPPARHIRGKLEDVCMCLALFADLTHPARQEGQAEAVRVYLFAASGLSLFLEAPEEEAWGTLSLARLWAVQHTSHASAALPLEDVQAFHLAAPSPHRLPLWYAHARATGHAAEAGQFAAWRAVATLLEALPTLEDGDAETALSELLDTLEEIEGGQPIPQLN